MKNSFSLLEIILTLILSSIVIIYSALFTKELFFVNKNNTKTEASYQEIVEWCSENASKLNLSNKEQQYLFEMSTRYLMKIKIGHWNEADANLIINYFAKTYANSQGIETDK